jgi:hypothetical protein
MTETHNCDSCKKDDGRKVHYWQEKDFALCRECVSDLYLANSADWPLQADQSFFESLSKQLYNDESINSLECTCVL